MSRTGVKRAINSSTTRKTRSSASQQQQVTGSKASASASTSVSVATASSAKKRQDGASKAKTFKSARKAGGPVKGKDEEERARVDGELQRLVGREGKGFRVAKERPQQPNLTQSQRPRVDAALTQTFEGLMK